MNAMELITHEISHHGGPTQALVHSHFVLLSDRFRFHFDTLPYPVHLVTAFAVCVLDTDALTVCGLETIDQVAQTP